MLRSSIPIVEDLVEDMMNDLVSDMDALSSFPIGFPTSGSMLDFPLICSSRCGGCLTGNVNNPIPIGTDIYESNDSFIFKMSVPGIQKKDLSINIEGDDLVVTGTKVKCSKEKDVVSGAHWHRMENPYGIFKRVLTLPLTVNMEKGYSADLRNGMLRVKFSKKTGSAASVSKTITIN